MPKMKSNSGAKKRFRKTATGKIKRKHAYKSHLLAHKSRKRKRNLKKQDIIQKVDRKNIVRLLPYL